MNPLDLVVSKDGSLSLTKLAASCFHFAIFVTVCWLTYIKREFLFEMWGLYAAVAVGHASYDKTLANVRAFKDRKLELDSPAGTEARATPAAPAEAPGTTL